MSSLTWTTPPTWMGLLVISHLADCSSLETSPCHLSTGPLFLPECNALPLLTCTSTDGLDVSPCYLSPRPLLQHECKSLPSFSRTTPLDSMGVPVMSHLNPAPSRMEVHFISHLKHCFPLDWNPCHLLPGPLLPPRWESLSSLFLNFTPALMRVLSSLSWTTAPA